MTAYTVEGVFPERNRPRPVVFQMFEGGRRNRGVVAGTTVVWSTAEEPSQPGVEKPDARGGDPTPRRYRAAPTPAIRSTAYCWSDFT